MTQLLKQAREVWVAPVRVLDRRSERSVACCCLFEHLAGMLVIPGPEQIEERAVDANSVLRELERSGISDDLLDQRERLLVALFSSLFCLARGVPSVLRRRSCRCDGRYQYETDK